MEGMKVVELKAMLKSRGLSCKGNKESLVKRLRDALNLQNERTSAPHSDDVEVRPDDSDHRLDLIHLIVPQLHLSLGERKKRPIGLSLLKKCDL